MNNTPGYFCCGGAAVNSFILRRALNAAKLRWYMHTAQLYSLELSYSLNVCREIMPSPEEYELLPNTKYTLLGIPIEINDKANKSRIELWQGDNLLSYIDALAVPAGF